MNIVNYEKLKEILRELWNRIKDQFIKSASLDGNTLKIEKENGSTIDVDLEPILRADNISYDDSNTALGLDNVQDVLEFLEKDKASLNKDNVFIGENTFNEVVLMGKTPFVGTNSGPEASLFTAGRYCGYRPVSTGQQQKYVSAIKIRVDDALAIGDMVNNVYIVEIKKRTDRITDVVGDKIAEDSSFIVEEENGIKVIYVPVGKTYTEDTYFLIGKRGTLQFRQCRYILPTEIADCVNALNIEDLPAKDDQLNHNEGNGWIVIHSLVTNDINVREALTSTTSLDGKVDKTDVGNEDNKIPRLENGKLVEKIIPEIAITRIIDATDRANVLDKVTSGDIQVGDSVRLTGEQNKVYQYTGIEVGDFADRFIEISQGDTTVRTINSNAPVDGNFQFALEETTDKVKLQVGGQDIAEVNFATTQEITELKNLLAF